MPEHNCRNRVFLTANLVQKGKHYYKQRLFNGVLYSKLFISLSGQKQLFSTCCWWWCHRGGWALDDWTWPQEVGQCWGSGLCARLEHTSSKWLQPAPRLQQEWQWTGQCRTKWSLQNGNPQTDSLLSAENGQFLRFYRLTEVNSLITWCLRSQSPSVRAANTPLQRTWHELEKLWCSQGRGTDQGHRSESQKCSQRIQRAQFGNL